MWTLDGELGHRQGIKRLLYTDSTPTVSQYEYGSSKKASTQEQPRSTRLIVH